MNMEIRLDKKVIINDSATTLLSCTLNQKNTLLLNYSLLDSFTNRQMTSDFLETNGYQNLVIFNIPQDVDVLTLKDWPKLKGLFYVNTQAHIIEQGLEAIQDGALWFPRNVTDIWIREMLESEEKAAILTHNLTLKEVKVLSLLSKGVNNTKIADTLFISEATVRVHLHKIYQKINVKNKQRALQWCEKNIHKFSNLPD
ncbi:LuxR C-terminal-related transcriptional regulator [Pseudoalteromonas lipolytica]